VAPAQARKAYYFKYRPAVASRPEAISYSICLVLVFAVGLIIVSAERQSMDVVDKAVAEFLAGYDRDGSVAEFEYNKSFFENFTRVWPVFVLPPFCVLIACPLIIYFTTKSGNIAYYVSGIISFISYLVLVLLTALITSCATDRPAPRYTTEYAAVGAECLQNYSSVFSMYHSSTECAYSASTPGFTTLAVTASTLPIPCLIQHVYSLLLKLRPDFTRGCPRVTSLIVYTVIQTVAIMFVVLFAVIAVLSDLGSGIAYFTDCVISLAYAIIYMPVLQWLRADYVDKMTLAMEIVERKVPITSFDDLA